MLIYHACIIFKITLCSSSGFTNKERTPSELLEEDVINAKGHRYLISLKLMKTHNACEQMDLSVTPFLFYLINNLTIYNIEM